jgi:hypothetical protein
MTQLVLVDGTYDSSPSQRVANRLADDWLVYAALLPALLIVAGIALTGAAGFGAHNVKNTAAASAIYVEADYVQGLAKLGIAKLPPTPAR